MEQVYGPILPPHLQKEQKINQKMNVHGPRLIGPCLPEQDSEATDLSLNSQKVEVWNPELSACMLPINEESNMIYMMNGDIYGPMPAGTVLSSEAQLALEERAVQLKIDQLKPKAPEVPERESWMLELPEVTVAGPSAGSRHFKNRPGPEVNDRDAWTATPSTKEKKEKNTNDIRTEAQLRSIKRRDREQEDIATKYRRKETSLLEAYKNSMEQAMAEAPTTERRPFNRETDLRVLRFEEAQTKAILKKANLLDDKFASGRAKYL